VEGGEARALDGRVESVEPQDPAAVGVLDLQRVEARLVFEGRGELEVLELESRLFHETNPWHRDVVSLSWHGSEPVFHSFEGPDTRWRFEPAHVRRPSVLASFLRLGVRHILGGYDHLAFLLVLVVAARGLRTLLGVVTAFTLAHSITLAAAALGWVALPPRFVELAIALSIAYVACENLLRRESRNPWIEAFGFGLLHGLGFAGFLADALAGEPLILTALVGFNLGVELGQLVAVGALLALGAVVLARWRRPGAAPGLVPPSVRQWTSGAVALLALYWFAQRAGWIG